jgi:O-antigen/teichoic acid export membrane protein
MGQAKRIAKNALVLFIAQASSIALSIVVVIFLARFLLSEGYGKYSFVFSFIAIFAIFIDWGFNTLLTREVARNKKDLNLYFNNAASIRLILSGIILFLIILTINLMKYPADVKTAVYVISISTIIGAFSDLFSSAFRAFEKMEYEALTNIIEKIIVASVSIFLLFQGYGLIEVCYIFLFGSMVRFFTCLYIYKKKFGETVLKFEKNNEVWIFLIKNGLPFALAGIFTILYMKIDTVMLSLMKGNSVVGWYNAAQNITTSLSFIAGVFLASIFPVISGYFITSKESLKKVYNLSFKYLFIIILPISAGIFLLSERIILLLFTSEYIPSIGALRILTWLQIFAFLGWLSGVILNSMNKQKLFTYAVGIGALINIILNLILIPTLSLYGAAIATLITQIIVFSVLFYLNNKYLGSIKLDFATKAIIATVFMSLSVLAMNKLTLAIIIPAGALVYFTAFYLIKGFSEEDKEILSSIIKPKK